jgi:hypothetical protein
MGNISTKEIRWMLGWLRARIFGQHQRVLQDWVSLLDLPKPRKGEASITQGTTFIGKKQRIESDDGENNHGEGKGESEKDLPGLSQDGSSL